MNPKVSIVIACYNDPFVVEAVRSASGQNYRNIEIIIVDDGSNKDIAALIRSLEKNVDHIIVQRNSGQSIARNHGIAKAKGELILNLDSDDFFEPEFCEKAVEVFLKEEDVKIVTCNARRFSKEGDSDVFVPRGGKLDEFLFSNSALGSSMFRRKDWERVGGYEEILPILGFEDWELYLNMLKEGGRAHVINEVLFHYRIREGSTTRLIQKDKEEKFRHIILKHRDLYSSPAKFESLVNTLFQRIEKNKADQGRILNEPEYRLGKLLLNPVRIIQNIFKK